MSSFATSPVMPVDSGIVRNPKEFSDALTLELTDEEIQQALSVTLPIRKKWQARFRYKFSDPSNFTVEKAMKLMDAFEAELSYELATRCHLLVHVDVEPVFEGRPPIITFEGALPSHPSAKFGLDHEKKGYEVKKSIEKNESFLGESQL